VRELYLDRVTAEDRGELRADLLALVSETYELLFEGPGRVIEDLVRGSAASRELADVVRSTTQARRRAFHQAMNRAVARGELDPAIDHDLVIDLLVGPCGRGCSCPTWRWFPATWSSSWTLCSGAWHALRVLVRRRPPAGRASAPGGRSGCSPLSYPPGGPGPARVDREMPSWFNGRVR
jgi:hypothetical protein